MTHPLQHKVNRTIVTVSGLTPQVVVSATSGVTVNIVDIQLKNNQNYAIDVGVYEESTLVTPTVPLGPSGTYLAEDLGLGFGLRLTDGSGVKATAGPVGTADVMIAWTPFDVSQPRTKGQYRRATFDATSTTTAIRRPTRSGSQSEGG